MVPSPIAMDSPDKMASRTRHFRNIFEELDVIRENVVQFSNGSPSLRMLAKLRPVLYEATRIRTVSVQGFETGLLSPKHKTKWGIPPKENCCDLYLISF